MKREEWEEVLYANVKDEVEQDRLNQYVLELEAENNTLSRELQRMGNQYAKVARLNGVIRRQRKQLTDVQVAIARRNSENAKLREENKRMMSVAVKHYTELLNSDDVLGQIMARKKLQELGIKVDK